MAEKHEYTGRDGTSVTLDNADALAAAVSDIGLRLLALETKPEPTAADGGGTTAARLDRLASVLEPYFGGEFLAYDRARASSDDAKAAANANAGQGTTGNGVGASGGSVNGS